MLRKACLLLVAVGGTAHLSCVPALFTAPPGSFIQLYANPMFVSAYGGVSIITAVVTEPAGTPVSDGTVVQFFTTLGQVDEEGKTKNGIAHVNFVSDSRSGTASIVAVSGGQAAAAGSPSGSPGSGSSGTGSGTNSASVSIAVGAPLVTSVHLTANPTRIFGDSRTSQLVATAFDTNGNPVANAVIFFTLAEITSPTATTSTDPAKFETLASGGNPVFTDNNGRAYDTITTRYGVDRNPRWILATATAPVGASGATGLAPTVVVQID